MVPAFLAIARHDRPLAVDFVFGPNSPTVGDREHLLANDFFAAADLGFHSQCLKAMYAAVGSPPSKKLLGDRAVEPGAANFARVVQRKLRALRPCGRGRLVWHGRVWLFIRRRLWRRLASRPDESLRRQR